MRSSTRLSIFSALLICGLWNRPAAAHPAWGIVIDSQGRVVFSEVETNTLWRIENGRPQAILRGRHSHEVYLDEAGNLYGEHLRYEPEGERWIVSLWKLTPERRELEVRPPTDDVHLPPGLGSLRDRQGNTYAFRDAFQRVDEIVLYRRTPAGEATRVAGGPAGHADGRGEAARFTGASGKAFGPDGNLYVTDGAAVRRITPDGEVTTLGGNPLAGVSHGKHPRLFGLAVDAARNILVADYDHRRVLAIAPDGQIRERWRSGPLWSPTGVTVAGGSLYVLETRPEALVLLGRIGPAVRVWRIAPDGSEERVAVLGEWNRGVGLAGAGLAGALAVVLIARSRRRARLAGA